MVVHVWNGRNHFWNIIQHSMEQLPRNSSTVSITKKPRKKWCQSTNISIIIIIYPSTQLIITLVNKLCWQTYNYIYCIIIYNGMPTIKVTSISFNKFLKYCQWPILGVKYGCNLFPKSNRSQGLLPASGKKEGQSYKQWYKMYVLCICFWLILVWITPFKLNSLYTMKWSGKSEIITQFFWLDWRISLYAVVLLCGLTFQFRTTFNVQHYMPIITCDSIIFMKPCH